MIEVPRELRGGREAKIEDRVLIARENGGIDAVLPGAVALRPIRERELLAVMEVAHEPREHDGGAHPIEAVPMCGDDDVTHRLPN